VARILARVEPILQRPLVVELQATVDRFGRAGGGLLASAVAFNALFAIVPMLLLASGVIGLVAQSAEAQQKMIEALVRLAPPLAPLIEELVGNLSGSSASLSVIGLVLAAWGTTRLYASIEEAISLMFADVPARSIVRKTIRRILSALILAGIPIALIVIQFVLSLLPVRLDGSLIANGVVAWVLTLLFVIGLVGAIYRFVPPVRPGFRAAAVPTVVVGVVLSVGTNVFSFVAPRLIAANAVSGSIGALFVGLTWLGLTFNVLLFGAAWTRTRMVLSGESAPPAGSSSPAASSPARDRA
jgi:membrane protein